MNFCYTLFRTGSTCRNLAKNYLWRQASECLLFLYIAKKIENGNEEKG